MIDSALATFLQQGLAMHIGARDERLEPEGARVLAARVEPDARHLVVYVADVAAGQILPLLEQNGQAAVTFARPVDDRACQVKGVSSTLPRQPTRSGRSSRPSGRVCSTSSNASASRGRPWPGGPRGPSPPSG